MIRRLAQLSLVLVLVFFTSIVWSATYYVDWENGNDANDGLTKSTPWKRAPGMQGCSDNCATYESAHNSRDTTGAGNRFILKGGVTWPNSVLAWDWNHGGGTGWGEGERLYFGVDATWFAGSSWSRPIIDAQSLPVTPDPVTGSSAMVRFYKGTNGYFVVDNMEFKGLRQIDNGLNGTTMLNMQTTKFEVKNCYFHGWSHGGEATKEQVVILYSNLTTTIDLESSIHHNVWDGSDTTGDMAKAYKGSAGHFYNNYVKGMYNGLIALTTYVWGNTFIDIGETFDPTGHGNVVESPGSQLIIYNNYISGSDGGATVYHTCVDGLVDYNFNNVIISDWNQANQIGSTGLTTGVGSGIYVFNNTIQSPEGSSARAIAGPLKVGTAKLPFMAVYNNHLIADNPTASFGTQVAEGGQTEANNIGMKNLQATNAGYIASGAYPFSPTSGGVTSSAGVDLRHIAAGIPSTAISGAASAALNDTSCGVQYDQARHRVIGSNRTPVVRGTAWDVGAYQSAVSQPTPLQLIPPQNLKIMN